MRAITGTLFQLRRWRRQAITDARHFREVRAALERRLGGLAGARILDLGCGAKFNQLVLLHSLGVAEVVGLDIAPVPLLPTSLRDAARWAVYYGQLARSAGVRLRFEGLRVLQGDAHQLPLAAGSVDAVVSNAVFEHIPDVPAAAREIRRVLRPGGVALVGIHLWTSPSGSHHPAVAGYPLRAGRWPRGLAPWFHLRGLPPFDAARAPTYGYQQQYLNRLRDADYRAAFAGALLVEGWERPFREGAELLSAEVRRALPGYTEEELTTRSLRVTASANGHG